MYSRIGLIGSSVHMGKKKGVGGGRGKCHLISELQKGGNKLEKIRQNIVLINQTLDCAINRT
jgi:hypothetical protein